VRLDFIFKWNALVNIALENDGDSLLKIVILKDLEVVVDLIHNLALHYVVKDDEKLSIKVDALINELIQVCNILILFFFLIENAELIFNSIWLFLVHQW
jgi:hypothetical protein